VLKGDDLYTEGDEKFNLAGALDFEKVEYEIEAILACFRINKNEGYLVKWKG